VSAQVAAGFMKGDYDVPRIDRGFHLDDRVVDEATRG
jgi:hypothetical protein